MSVPSVSNVSLNSKTNNVQRKFNYVKYSGYAALGFGIASGVAASSFKKIKVHKYLAYAAGILAVVHTALIEMRRFNQKDK